MNTAERAVFSFGARVNRILLSVNREISKRPILPSLDELLIFCQRLSPLPCLFFVFHISFIDNFLGGIVLYFWLIVEGSPWIRRLIKNALQVKKILFKKRDLILFFGIFDQNKSNLFLQVRLLISPSLPMRIMELPKYRTMFKAWLLSKVQSTTVKGNY